MYGTYGTLGAKRLHNEQIYTLKYVCISLAKGMIFRFSKYMWVPLSFQRRQGNFGCHVSSYELLLKGVSHVGG